VIAVDTSAVVAILLGEPDAERFARTMEGAPRLCMSAGTAVELGRVMWKKKGQGGVHGLRHVLRGARVEVAPLTPQQADIAIEASWRFPVLNYGDTLSYALAKARDIPLLFKGNDFTHTDIRSAL
jgi:ribonuclease VapC